MQTVVTHNGNFHPDDVFALATMQLYLGKDQIQIIRSRDEEVISKADWVIDVGEVYDVDSQLFDHHQNGAPVRDNGIPYAAFGLVWKEFGEKVSGSKEIAIYIEECLAQPIDAGDNAVSLYELDDKKVRPFELFTVVHSYRPVWGSDKNIDDCFLEAVDFARGLLERMIESSAAGLDRSELVEASYNAAEDKSIIVFEESVDRHMFIKYADVNVIVYKSDSSGVVKWKAEVVPVEYNSFESRVDFPASWGALREEELEQESGIKDSIFCHKGRFLFVAKTKEAALAAAKQAN